MFTKPLQIKYISYAVKSSVLRVVKLSKSLKNFLNNTKRAFCMACMQFFKIRGTNDGKLKK